MIDGYVYHKFTESKLIFLVLYVDDIMLATNDIDLLHETKIFRSNNFKMVDLFFFLIKMVDLSDASFALGIKIHRNRS